MSKDEYEDDRFTGICPTCCQPFYKEAFEAAKAFIDSHVADPDITSEMVEKYSKYQNALKHLQEK